jgi:hypothetical protein
MEKNKGPGMEPYTPTKLEWILLNIKADYSSDDLDEGFHIAFGHNAEDTIIIDVLYHHGVVDREIMNDAVESARRFVEVFQIEHDWLKIEERYQRH